MLMHNLINERLYKTLIKTSLNDQVDSEISDDASMIPRHRLTLGIEVDNH
jgi:hypothetical protein